MPGHVLSAPIWRQLAALLCSFLKCPGFLPQAGCLSPKGISLGLKCQWISASSSVQFSRSVMSDSLQPHGPQHSRPPCPSPTPGVYLNSYPLSQWCHPTILSSVVPFSSCPQSFPVSGSFQMSQFFISGGQSIGVSASISVLPMNTQDWIPLGVNHQLMRERQEWVDD